MALDSSKRGSALVLAIWVILVLSLLVMNFMVEAKLQAGINLYVRERGRLDALTEAGRVIAENMLTTYSKVQDYSEDEEWEELYEKDHWLDEKRQLKENGTMHAGPFVLDGMNPETSHGTVTIEIGPPSGGTGIGAATSDGWNINDLYSGGNSDYRDVWSLILERCNVPEEDWDEFIDSWNDWRDSDGTITGDKGGEDEYYEDLDLPDEEKYKPRNGEIVDLRELAMVKCFRDHPAVLTGGDYDAKPDDEDEEGGSSHRSSSKKSRRGNDNRRMVNSILPYFTTIGSGKINVNHASFDLLMTVPGIANVDDPDDEEAEEIANAIIESRNYRTDDRGRRIDDEDYGPIKDWNALQLRTEGEIGSEAQRFLCYGTESDEKQYFEIRITGESGGISHTVKAIAVLQDDKIRYVRWIEDP